MFRAVNDSSSFIVTNATHPSESKVSCLAPVVDTAGPWMVSVVSTNDNITTTSTTTGTSIPFNFLNDAVIFSVFPSMVPLTGGNITLNGRGFLPIKSLECVIDGSSMESSRAIYISEEQMECEVPGQRNSLDGVNIHLSLYGVQFSNAVEVRYYPLPVMASLHPDAGSKNGGTVVTVLGSNFISSSSIACRFGDAVVAGEYVNATAISCITPPQSDELSPVAVSISLNGIDYHDSSIQYTYFNPKVQSIHPKKGYYFGGTKIRVTGSGFEDVESLVCVFESTEGKMTAFASFISSTEVECVTPALSEPGILSIKVSLDGINLSSNNAIFVSLPPAIITSMAPESGTTSGLSKVHLFGKGFLNGESTGCRFRDVTVPAEWISSTVVICKPISLNPSAGYATVAYTNDGIHFIEAESQFLFIHRPSVLDVSPRSGLRSGGERVLITVDEITNLLSWTCSFGEAEVQAALLSSSMLECETPSSQQDLVEVKLLSRDHHLEVDTGCTFQYYDRLEIESIFPESAPTLGGTAVNITMRGLRDNSTYVCVFEGKEDVVANMTNNSTLTCDSPKSDYPEMSALAVKSVHSSPELTLKSNFVPFTIYQHPVIRRVHPTIFYAQYPPDIEISGHEFIDSNTMTCRIDELEVQARWISSNKIVCGVPKIAQNPHQRRLFFSLNGVNFVDTHVRLQVLPELIVNSVHPNAGSMSGGINTVVKGDGFHGSIRYHCHFGDDAVEAKFVNSSSVSCSTPSVSEPGTRPFSLCLDNGDCVNKSVVYTFEEPLRLLQVDPKHGPFEGGTMVKVKTNRILGDYSQCLFGMESVAIEPDSDLGGYCISPPFGRIETDNTQAVKFYVLSEGHHRSDELFHYIYHPTRRLEDNSTSTNSTLNEHYKERLLIERVTPELLVRGSPHSKLLVEGRNIFLNDTLPIEECRLGTTSVNAQVMENESDIFKCDFNDELPPLGSYQVTFMSQQFGNIDADAKVQIINNPTLLRLEPVIIIPRDTVKIFVYGDNFVNHNTTCFVNENAYPATFLTSSRIICRIAGSDLVASSYKVSVSNDGHFAELPSLLLEVAPIPYIAELDPPTGKRGMNITLRGKGFHPQMKCHAEGSGELASRFINSSAMECSLPLVHHSSNVSLSLALEERQVSNVNIFTLLDIRVSSMHPTFGSVDGGSSVVFTLNELSTSMITHCKFGETVVYAALDHDKALCVSPSTNVTGLVPVELGVNERDFVEVGYSFDYVSAPKFTAIEPSFGSETGGKVVKLFGRNFINSNIFACYFDEAQAQCQWVSQEEIMCITPKLRPGNYSIFVSLNGVDLVDTLLQYQVRLQMTTVFTKPTFGSMAGGAVIQVFGTNFQRDDSLSCKLGERTSTASFIGPNVIECIAPSHDVAELVDLGIVSESGDASFVDEGFQYLVPFELMAYSPDSGPGKGGTRVTFFGSGFTQIRAPIYCTFGTSSVDALVISDHELNCISPPMASLGGVDVVITHGSDDFKLLQQFSYDNEIVLYYGPKYSFFNEQGHNNLTVHGSFFRDKQELACCLEPGTHILEATFLSQASIVCALPTGLRAGTYKLTVSNNGQDFSNSGISIWLMDPLKVHFIEPLAGITGMETSVSLRGHGFKEFDELSCLIDDTHALPLQFVDSEEIHCTLPSNLHSGVVSLSLASQGVRVSNAHNFTFIGFEVNTIYPMLGATTGGTPVIIGLEKGDRNAISHCMFGYEIVSANLTNGLLVCETPPMTGAGPVPLGLSVNGRDFQPSPLEFEYYSPVKLLSISPNNGPESGGTAVNLFGSNFVHSGSISCYFGTYRVTGERVSENNVVCVTPKLKPGSYAMKLSINGVDIMESFLYYRSDHELDVLKAIPPVGMHTGTSLTIIGKSFIPSNDLLCSFGEHGISPAFYVGPTEIRCQSPNVEISKMITTDLRISLNGVDFSASSAPLSISPLPEIIMLHPDRGLVSGGTQIVVKGMHFIMNELISPTCKFGKISVPAVINSNTELTCISPPVEHEGAFSFTVSMNSVDQARVGVSSFLYLPTVETLSIEPSSGSFVGGTLVTITGKKFMQSHDFTCHFGEVATNVSFLNDSRLQCTSPSHPPGVVPFYVNAFDTNVMNGLAFEFYMPHQVISAFPSNGPYRGGTLVKVHGRNFRSNVGYLCNFGNASSPVRYLSSEFVECESPMTAEQDSPKPVMLDIIEEGSNYTHGELMFTYGPQLVAQDIRPRLVPFEGGASIAVLGNYINTIRDVWCRFTFNFSSDVVIVGEFVDSNRIDCPAPSCNLLSQDQTEGRVQVSSNIYDWSNSLSFTYITRPIVESLRPDLGPVSGGTRVSISGSNFPPDKLWCDFEGVGLVRAEWETSDKIHCMSPPLSSQPIHAAVTLRTEDGSLIGGNDPFYFNYHRDLSLEQVYPARGYITGGSRVTIFGTGFIDINTTYCHFDSVLASATFVSPISIQCRTPKVNYSQIVQVGVSLNGQDIVSHSRLIFNYDPQPEFDRIVPSNVPITNSFDSRHNFVTIFGSSFTNTTSARCLFGNDWPTDALFVSESEIKCELPNITEPGVYPISISLSNSVEFSQQSIDISFVEPAVISSIRPSAVQEGSETVLIISGGNFISSPGLQCHFGEFGHLWTQAVWKSNKIIECTSPPLNLTAQGHTLIGITNNGGHDVSTQFPLEVTARARFLSMYPSQGYTSGGTDVSIVLGYLRIVANRKMHCKFGEQTVSVTIVRSVVACVSPPNPRGKVLVALMVEGEIQPLASGNFEYIDEPIVRSLEPSIGMVEGGTTVTLKGLHFEGVTHCRFHNIIVPVAAAATSEQVVCLSPISDAIQDIEVQVTHNGQDFAPSGVTFSYRPKPIIFSMMPSFGGANVGGKTVYITGSNFTTSPLLSCRCDEAILKATFITDTLISCKMPQMKLGRYPLDISLNGADFIASDLSYESINLPQMGSMHPKIGMIDGSTTVIINTTALPKTDRLACHFGQKVVTAKVLDRNSLSCIAPPTNETKTVNVSLSVDGDRLYDQDEHSLQFSYVDYPIIQSISPEFGWTVGGSNITLFVGKVEPFNTHEFFCSFGSSGSTLVRAILFEDNQITCVLPAFEDYQLSSDVPVILMISDGVNYVRVVGPIFKYLVPSIITGIEPSLGSVHGGSSVTVFGFNFAQIDGLRCFFAQNTVLADWINEGEIRCTSPGYAGAGDKEVTVHIGIEANTTLSVESHGVFKYMTNPIIRDFYPKFGSSNGGTRVTLHLVYPWQNATKHVACRFGNSALTMAYEVSQDEIACITPSSMNATGQSEIEVQNVLISLHATHGHETLSLSDDKFTYMNEMKVLSLTPNSGSFLGGTALGIKARGLEGVDPTLLSCYFDDAVTPVTFCAQEDIKTWICECITPSVNASGVVLLQLGLNDGQDVASIGQLFTFYEPPDILSIQPSTGFLEGGEFVRVKGINFLRSSTLKCSFGDLESDAIYVSSKEVLCNTPVSHFLATVQVRVSNNGVEFTGGKDFMYTHRPDASAILSNSAKWNAMTTVTMTGKHLVNVTSCRFGNLEQAFPSFNVSNYTLSCLAPPADTYLQPDLSDFRIPIFLETENSVFPTGFEIGYEKPYPIQVNAVHEPEIFSVTPSHATSYGGQWIRIRGENFFNRLGLQCIFGNSPAQHVRYVSLSEIHCMTPRHIPGTVSFRVTNERGSSFESRRGFNFTFIPDFSITYIAPKFGSIRGGVIVNLYGSFPTLRFNNAVCKFGVHGVVEGEILSQNHITCKSPKASKADTIELSVSMDGGENFAKSTTWFSYELESEVLSITPSYGYRFTNTTSPILIGGKNFKNSTELKCLFGGIEAPARFISDDKVSCFYPPSADLDEKKVPVRVFVERDIVPSSWRYFEYIDPPSITSYTPHFGGATVGVGDMIIRGSGFSAAVQLYCMYGDSSVRATFVHSSTLRCSIPSHPPGEVRFSVVDQYSSHPLLGFEHDGSFTFHFIPESSIHSVIPMWNASKYGSISFVKGSNVNANETNIISKLTEDLIIVPLNRIQPYLRESFIVQPTYSLPATNGTYMSSTSHNLTFCEPGTFQPQNGQEYCLLCPVGYFCPFFGMSQPMVCPIGFICSRLGLSSPSSSCVAGHYCLEGTKTASEIAKSSTNEWKVHQITGVITAKIATVGAWDYTGRESPASGSRRVLHPPLHANITAQQPFPCALGFYCQVGVGATKHRKGDFTTPQPCHAGYFCARGSTSSVGSGACPPGYYCATRSLATACDVGHYCPGSANTFPLPCFPGSYSGARGQSICDLCEVGYQCPGWGRSEPEPCQAGYVCDEPGLSIPEKPCPPGYYCNEGTSTADPQSQTGRPPLPCPPGLFCLYGVARRDLSPIDGLPSFDLYLPQLCAEGYFCSGNSSNPLGDRPCFPGHYCPTSSQFPIEVPPGTVAADEGSIVPTLCLPGTFSPRPGSVTCSPCPAGFSCLSYGTFTPRICDPGTYRSKADSIPCKPCPERTYSRESGSADISQCLPCLEGRVCSYSGLTDVQKAAICPEGHTCGYVTNRPSQYSQQCAGGCYCGNQTGIADQYSSYCTGGHYCQRGTSEKLHKQRKCPQSHFCSNGSSYPLHFLTRCPRQTTSNIGSEVIESCVTSPVAICDKKSSTLTNPFDEMSYYPIVNDAGAKQYDLGEVEVLKKVLPLNKHSSNIMPWKNDTVEVLRTCPSFGIVTSNSSNSDAITVIGRNFRNSSELTCRFRVCSSSKLTYVGEELILPNVCKNDDADSIVFSSSVLVGGVFVDENRVKCQLPDFEKLGDFEPLPTTSAPSAKTMICMRDHNDNIYLSKECPVDQVSSGECLFESNVPSLGLRKRIYSLLMPCFEIDATEMCFNPCLTRQVHLDVSNNGKKFSGDSTMVSYRSDPLPDKNEDMFVINATFSVFNLIKNETMAMRDEADMRIFNMGADNDKLLCHRPSAVEESSRLSEDGWFQADYMTRIIMSFDWRHIPSHIVYNQHFKLAIFVRPSRCDETKCLKSERKHQVVENIPCLHPLNLPVWFESDTINKHQMINLTMLSLDDVLFKVEVQVISGVSLSLADFFKRTMTINMEHPERAKSFGENKRTRTLSPLVSWEESPALMHHMFGIRYDKSMFDRVSPPMNLPPRWKSFERGRVLLSMNTTHENSAPTIKDEVEASVKRNKDFWSNPYGSVLAAKQKTDIYFETWHGLALAESESDDSFKYDHDSVILPYLPYFSNCREFDSYVPLWAVVESSERCNLPGVTADRPENWWRRRIPSLPHQDDVKSVGPQDLLEFYPIADWCERKLFCQYEENLSEADVKPRWFEAETGATLFSIIRDPINYFDYSGRNNSTTSKRDGGGQRFINGIDSLEAFIPAKVDRSPAFNVEDGCATSCFPRKVTLDISYQQVDVHTKRIVQVKLFYDKFDKNQGNDQYELQVKFYALNYQELVIKFAFSRSLFLLLFAQMGFGTIVAAFAYWIVIRITTRLEEPPSLRIAGFLLRIFPSALGGVLMGLLPVSAVTFFVYYTLKGHEHFGSPADPEGRRWLLLSTIKLNYSDATIDPDLLHSVRQGRTGFAFLTMSLVSFYFTSHMFVPKRKIISNSTSIVPYGVISDRSISWRRSNFIYSSILMSMLLVVIVEWSFWGSFGTYIWEAIIFMKFLSMIVGSLVDAQLGEALLSAPVMTAMGMIQGIVTMSANDFMDFLLSYIVGFGFLMIERMYIGPLQADFVTWMAVKLEQLSYALFPKTRHDQKDATALSESFEEDNNETLEPLLGSFANYSCDTLSLLYYPFIMIVIMIFRDEAEITKMYGIKEADMEYYILFALTIVPFQIIADALLHNSLELLHGWKTLDYLEYCRVRFYQREVWWKGLESNTLDECIEESLRSIDQLCFSSQYYMLNTIHVNAIVYFVIGVEMMTRANYNLFGDPAMIVILAAVIMCSAAIRAVMIWIAKSVVWRVRFDKRNWHDTMQTKEDTNLGNLGDIQTSTDHDLYQMEMKITDETFRYKFLRYNRSWIINQDLLTPRVTQRMRPLLINQLSRILGSINEDISSDSEDDEDYEFEMPVMKASTRTIARGWLKHASRLLKLRSIVQPIIQQSRGNECEICLSRNLLQVQLKYSLEEIDSDFVREYGNSGDQLDQVLFQRYFRSKQQYQTICLPCIQQKQKKRENELINDDRDEDMAPTVSGLTGGLNESSTSIMEMWYAKAQERLQHGH